MMFNVHTVAGRTKAGQRQDLDQASYTFHGYSRTEGIAGVIVTDDEYPSLVAHQILSKLVDEFHTKYPRASSDPSPTEDSCPFPSPLAEWIEKYDDPSNADSIMKIQQELDSTKIVLHKTVPFPNPIPLDFVFLYSPCTD
jgi:synaptobrevin family protein YKT6